MFLSTVNNDLDVRLNLLHVIIVCSIISLEEGVETFIVLHHGPCSLYVCFHATHDAPNEIQEFNAVLCVMGLIKPFGSF